jgi:serine phosphatase RsbU (regulator of sigma subunit)
MVLSQAHDITASCQTQLEALETRLSVLTGILTLICVGAVVALFLFQRTRNLRRQKNRELEEQQHSNVQVLQLLEQKQREVEVQRLELRETSTELKWQTENALRLFDEVEQQKKELTDSIEYAKKIQTVLLPERQMINEVLNDYFVLFQPRDIVSGDFYWVNAKTEKTMVAVVDCTGHGVPGAFMSIMGINFLNSIVQDENLAADTILNLLRDQVIKALKQTGKALENKDGMDMALCIIDWANARIEYAGANIPLILLRSATDATYELIEISPDRMPIGIYEQMSKPFTRHTFPIMPGDSLYMFSDGYCDQFGGPDLKKFKKKNLIKLLAEIHTLDMAEQKKRLKRNIDVWQGDLPQVDDILMLGIKI